MRVSSRSVDAGRPDCLVGERTSHAFLADGRVPRPLSDRGGHAAASGDTRANTNAGVGPAFGGVPELL
jgi:hypothetical protein